ncbi:Ig-like domain-containing protein [Pseudoalteromonas piscicida]|uniref:Ig-like domain-containing protein n=1 Tax=Pseudoalteromonas piscicida TaxID=43662 RepID=UPI000E35D2FF|nr:Ig-like domain-containing protein [Pseudoalteromonas piscicida]AXQ99068.1 hypothetical protein D0N37_15965 [Pseudoalteromonas piscicida]
MKRSIISTIIASALLSACGGSSDNNDNDVIGGQGNFTVETSTAFTTQEDTTYTLAVSPKSAPSGNDTLTVEVIKFPTLGTLTSSGLSLSYQPAPNKNGTDSFTYKFKKGGVLSPSISQSKRLTTLLLFQEPPRPKLSNLTTAIISRQLLKTLTVKLAHINSKLPTNLAGQNLIQQPVS